MEWTDVVYVKWFYFDVKLKVKWVTVNFLGTKVPCTLGWTYTEVLDYTVAISCGCILYCGCFNLFCNGWVCVGVDFVMCGYFGSMCTCIYCVLYCLYCVFRIVSFMFIYSYLFWLYYCKDYCHRVKTQSQLVVVVVVVVVVIIIIINRPLSLYFRHKTPPNTV